MGVINKIRERSGLAVGIIATGLILFLIGGDLLSVNSILLGGSSSTLGEIAGQEISVEEFRSLLERNAQQYRLSTNQNPSASTMNALRDQTWQELIEQIAYRKQYEAIGLQVTEAELVDMVQGDHIRDDLKQAFLDQDSNEFDKDKLLEYLQNISQLPEAQQFIWYNYEKKLVPLRLSEKYNNLLEKSTYTTRAEAEALHREKNYRINLRYLYIPYDNLSDSSLTVSKEEALNYLRAHESDYQREHSRKAYYVTFPLVPSSEDTAYVQEEIQELVEELANSTEDSLFATAHTDGRTPYRRYGPDELPEVLKSRIDTLLQKQPDTLLQAQIIGPIIERNRYAIYKVIRTEEGTTEYVRASHILIKAGKRDGKEKEEAREEAKELLRKIQRGEPFEDMAKEHGTDGTASLGGDLGWFSRGRMVGEFEEAAYSATKKGLIPEVVETEFGFHIIKVTELPTRQQFIVASVEKDISARDKTRNKLYQKAVKFLSFAKDTSSFVQTADTMNLLLERAANILPTSTRMATLGNVREIVQWLYASEIGDVSEVFDVDSEFAVVTLTGEQLKGTANYEDVSKELKEKVLKQKKAEEAIKKLENKEATLDELSSLFPSDKAYVYTMGGARFSDDFLRNVGNDIIGVGAAFSLTEEGSRTSPIASDNGVLLIELTSLGKPPKVEDTEDFRDQLRKERERKVRQNLRKAMETLGEIEDLRYKFF